MTPHGSAGRPAGESGKLPVTGRFIVSKDVHLPVIGVDFEPALRWCKPAIDNATHRKSALAEPESERLLFTAMAGVALHTNRHGASGQDSNPRPPLWLALFSLVFTLALALLFTLALIGPSLMRRALRLGRPLLGLRYGHLAVWRAVPSRRCRQLVRLDRPWLGLRPRGLRAA